MEAMIEAIELKKEYISGKNKTMAINNISLTINRGEMIAIIGPSGCGKTTLLNMLGLIVRPTSGKIIIDNRETETLSEKERAKYRNKMFGYVVQDFALVEDYTVFENIEIPLLYSSVKMSKAKRKKMIEDVLEQVGLSGKIREKAKNLSGGQRQRVAIARAIVNDPEIILADEPTGSLDSKTGKEIINLLMTLVAKGKTLVLVTHDDSIAQKCDKQIKMFDGKIIDIIKA